jgi:hypothetical protein
MAGVTAIELRVGPAGVTVNVALPDAPERLAVMVELPALTAVASPAEFIVAVGLLEELHVAVPVTSLLDPSLKVPVALNCCVAPVEMEAVAGVTLTARTLVWPPPHPVEPMAANIVAAESTVDVRCRKTGLLGRWERIASNTWQGMEMQPPIR